MPLFIASNFCLDKLLRIKIFYISNNKPIEKIGKMEINMKKKIIITLILTTIGNDF